MSLPFALLALGGLVVTASIGMYSRADHGYVSSGYADSDVIVEGRIRGWNAAEAPPDGAGRITVAIHMTVARTLKGTAVASQIDITDAISVYGRDGMYGWAPPRCADCGPLPGFLEDPSERYSVIGLDRDSGSFVEVTKFYLGPEPSGSEYDRALRTIERQRTEQRNHLIRELSVLSGAIGGLVIVGAISGLLGRRQRRKAAIA